MVVVRFRVNCGCGVQYPGVVMMNTPMRDVTTVCPACRNVNISTVRLR